MRRQGAGWGLIVTLPWISLLHLQTEDILLEVQASCSHCILSFPLLISSVLPCTRGHSSSGSLKHSGAWHYLKSS